MILLIACVNLSNLLLARAASRSKEFGMRTALGASRGRLVRQLLTESLALSSAGAILGLALAYAVIAWVAHQGSIALPLLNTVTVDIRALGWTLLIAVSAAVLFGLAPGLKMSSGNLQEVLKDSGPGTSEGKKHERMRGALVISEVALACVLLIGAGLLLRSFLKVLDIDLGFKPDQAASIKVDYDDNAPTGDESAIKRGVIFQQILERVNALPGVEAAGIADFLPLGQNRAWGTPTPKGKTYPPGSLPGPLVYVVTPGFVEAMGMRLRGRDFAWSDTPKNENVVLINSSAARVFWPDEDPVGRILVSGKNEMRVVGVVDDIHADSVEGQPGGRTARGPHQPSSSSPRRKRAPCAARTQSEATSCRVPADSNHCGPRCLAAPVFCSACDCIRRVRIDPRHARYLRRYLLLGSAADTGDRHPHGVRRNPGARIAVRDGKDHASGGDWHCPRSRCLGCRCEVDRLSAFWNRAHRSGDLRRNDPHHGRGGTNRRIHPRPPSRAHQPDDCSPRQLKLLLVPTFRRTDVGQHAQTYGLITASAFGMAFSMASPACRCSSTRRAGVCASHSAREISS